MCNVAELVTHALCQLLGVLDEVVSPAVQGGVLHPQPEALGAQGDVGHGHVVVGGTGGVGALHRV